MKILSVKWRHTHTQGVHVPTEPCPLCDEERTTPYHQSEHRDYLHCPQCDLVFVPRRFFVSEEAERAKYDHHNNSIENSGYCRFLERLLVPLRARLPEGAYGLDFGSGPGPTLSRLMERAGYTMTLYDPFYAPDRAALRRRYDFITATEVIEHLHHPKEELKKLWGILRPGGTLGIMTSFRPGDEAFGAWYYKRDLTHVRFFSEKSFRWIAAFLGAELTLPERDVVLLHKSATTVPSS